MADGKTIDVSDLVDRQKVGPFHYKLIVWSFLITLLDGYELLAASFAAPEIARDWAMESSALAPMLSASLFGVLFGALGLGHIGDRLGRKPAIIISVLIFGVMTLAAAFSGSLTELTVLRFLAGIGIGGALPNTISLNAELAPKRLRATLIIIMFTGISIGGALPGPISAWLVPEFGWPVLFIIGGVFPLALAVLLYFVLPESVRFLALDDRRHARTVAMARSLEHELEIGPDDRFEVPEEERGEKARLPDLFRGNFLVITPLLWLLFMINFLVIYFFNSWMPTLFESAGASGARAAYATSIFQLGGVAGGLTLSRFLDRLGLMPVALYFAVAVPIVAAVGYVATSTLLMVAAFLAGFCVVGLQFGLNATAGMIYPTHIRANGVGFAFGIGRLGAVLGPLVGGALIALAIPIPQLFVIAAMPMALGAVACFVLARMQAADRRTAEGAQAGQ